jgi:hypothetical protein
MEEDGRMTVKLKSFGKFLNTRKDAQNVLVAISTSGCIPKLDFTGVKVANHPFADELGKGLVTAFSLSDLSEVKLIGANQYVKNCVAAGFSTAVNA